MVATLIIANQYVSSAEGPAQRKQPLLSTASACGCCHTRQHRCRLLIAFLPLMRDV